MRDGEDAPDSRAGSPPAFVSFQRKLQDGLGKNAHRVWKRAYFNLTAGSAFITCRPAEAAGNSGMYSCTLPAPRRRRPACWPRRRGAVRRRGSSLCFSGRQRLCCCPDGISPPACLHIISKWPNSKLRSNTNTWWLSFSVNILKILTSKINVEV